MVATDYERKIAERFAAFISWRDGETCSVEPASNPPDFLLRVGSKTRWLELTDIFVSNEEAKFLNQPEETKFKFECPVDQMAIRLLQQLNKKLCKSSYEDAAQQHGKGILLLTSQNCVFSEVDLAQIEQALIAYNPSSDRGFFDVAYFEYQLSGEPRSYMTVYPREAVPTNAVPS